MSRALASAAALAAGVLLAGCSAEITTKDGAAGSAPASASASPSATAPASTGITIPNPTVTITGLPGDGGGTGSATGGVTPTAGGGVTAALPPGFPLPPGATVTRSVDDGGEIAATLAVTDPAAAVTFWKSALPRAGYTVVSDESVGGLGEIRFSGHGCVGNSQLAIQGTSVTLQCDRG